MQDKSGRNRSIRISAEIREFIIRVFLRGGTNPKLVILSEPVRAKCALAEYLHQKNSKVQAPKLRALDADGSRQDDKAGGRG